MYGIIHYASTKTLVMNMVEKPLQFCQESVQLSNGVKINKHHSGVILSVEISDVSADEIKGFDAVEFRE